VRYEHLVQINDLARGDIALLTRSELWRGLVLRAARPELFDDSIDESRALSEDATQLVREVRRGEAIIRERVDLVPEDLVTLTVLDGTGLAGSALSYRIEEPAPGALFVRFAYELRGEGVPDAEPERQALRQAYYYADLQTVSRIREIAAEEAATPDSIAPA
jgi:hypothetical protein